jgi:hypothetical protein
MAFINSLKLSGAIAAGVLALGLSAPAQASSVTFELQYTTVSSLFTSTVDAFLTADNLGLVNNGSTKEAIEYSIDSISGTRTVASNGTGIVTKLYTISGLYDPAAGTPDILGGDYSDNIYVYTANALASLVGQAALDIHGVAFSATDGTVFKIYNDVAGLLYNGQFYYYAETNSVSGSDAALLNFTITEVPGPTALALLGVSLVGIGVVRRRKQGRLV